jgi:hypothetical protein
MRLTRLTKKDGYDDRADLFAALGECQLNLGQYRDARSTFETADAALAVVRGHVAEPREGRDAAQRHQACRRLAEEGDRTGA